ncbi:C-type lectin 37Db-like [Drosophila elegans]|uniref:C-type lectin 37Db-like n=1 Tax=Drosophila elegans TaxID=30023 RepID=UPI001BC84C36|nr:C-type lectin 37Db-like [Drosophila elegans]
MFKIGTYFLYAFVACNLCGIAKGENNTDSVCILKDAPTQCGAFCLDAQRPIIEKLNFLAKLLNNTQEKVDRILNATQERLEKVDFIIHNLETKPIEVATSNIPQGFEQIGSRYFYIENNIKLNWADAKTACRQKGAYLAAFDNLQEFSAIQTKLQAHWYWLGINEIAKEGEFVSVASGKPATIFKWHFGQPDNDQGREDCVAMYYSSMDDGLCDNKNYFICQLDNEV